MFKTKQSIESPLNNYDIPRGSERFRSFDKKGNEVWEVEDVLEEEVKEDGKTWYLVKWKGWSHKYNNWEPPQSFIGDIKKLKENFKIEKKLKSAKSTTKKIKKVCQNSSTKQNKLLGDFKIRKKPKYYNKNKLSYTQKNKERKIQSKLDNKCNENSSLRINKIKLIKCPIYPQNMNLSHKLIPSDVEPKSEPENSDSYPSNSSTKYTPSILLQNGENEASFFNQFHTLASIFDVDEHINLFSPMNPRFQDNNLLSFEFSNNENLYKYDPSFYHNQDLWEALQVEESWIENLEGETNIQPNLIMFKVIFQNKLTAAIDMAWLNNSDCMRFAPVAINQYLLMKFLEYQKEKKNFGFRRM